MKWRSVKGNRPKSSHDVSGRNDIPMTLSGSGEPTDPSLLSLVPGPRRSNRGKIIEEKRGRVG